ncbi:L,D-transpeptidase [Anoxybacter fermentans]|uniref:L,D-transpeptidase n=1 Tax=Anoxybacter fermentans TaxID=1323375 RepID=UPI00214FD97D|nr:L,D-transpeptidase [Anoxybacter fermentans]
MVVSLAERRLYLFENGRIIRSYPVAIGKPSTPTPTGEYSIRHKLKNPGGPFGTRWMSFKSHYGIHGTNSPGLIGQAVSHGCIRMLNKDIEELYDLVQVGTPVKIIAGSL